jgi:phosphatidylinositol 4-kinase
MVVLMGGRDSQGYRLFTDLTVKAFLAIRPFADQLVDTVHLMLGTGLPSFKGEPTIKRLRDRFQLQLGERAAAEYMVGVIRNAHENYRSTVYDGFQKAQKWVRGDRIIRWHHADSIFSATVEFRTKRYTCNCITMSNFPSLPSLPHPPYSLDLKASHGSMFETQPSSSASPCPSCTSYDPANHDNVLSRAAKKQLAPLGSEKYGIEQTSTSEQIKPSPRVYP